LKLGLRECRWEKWKTVPMSVMLSVVSTLYGTGIYINSPLLKPAVV